MKFFLSECIHINIQNNHFGPVQAEIMMTGIKMYWNKATCRTGKNGVIPLNQKLLSFQ